MDSTSSTDGDMASDVPPIGDEEVDTIRDASADADSSVVGDALLSPTMNDTDTSPVASPLREEILAMDKGTRPEPETYLSPEYIANHLAHFNQGSTRIMTQANFDKYGIGREDGKAFVLPRSFVDDVIARTGGDLRATEKELGLPRNFLGEGAFGYRDS